MLEELADNTPIWSAVIAWAIAQFLKIILTYISEKKIDLRRAYGSGGMPSSHTAFSVALAINIGKIYGFNAPSFSVACVLAMIVMYDAAGVRRAAGQHAAAINELFKQSGLNINDQLKELLGHTPLQVFAGAVLGIFVGMLC